MYHGNMATQEERSVVQKAASVVKADAVSGGSDLSALILDAKLGELCSSIRALARSNDELREALKEQPDDLDFITAIHENEEIIVKRREAAAELVRHLRKAGIDADLPEDVLQMQMEWKGSSEGGAEKKGNDADNDEDPENTSADSGEGLYL